MIYKIELRPGAVRDLKNIPKSALKKIDECILSLAENPYPRRARKLSAGEDIYRIRAGDYRILYAVRRKRLLVLVLRVGHHRDIYRRIS